MQKRFVLGAVCLFGLNIADVRAEFMIGVDPNGEKFYNGSAYKDVTSFTGSVGSQDSTDFVTVTTNVGVDTGAGFSNIKPADNGSVLTTLTFTPANPDLFNSFSFGGLLENSANGTVILTVQDNQGNAAQTFTYSGLGNGNIGSLGIVAIPGSGETIKSVTLSSVWKQEMQNTFSRVQNAPEPSSLALLGLGGAAFCAYRRRKMKTAI